jgi:predicted nucleic acid-binding protein
MALSVPVFEEYKDVLLRPDSLRQLKLTDTDARTFLRFLAAVGVATATPFRWRPNLQDEADNMFVELAVASGSEYLITSNTRDFTVNADLRFDSFRAISPRECLSEWRKRHGEH